MIRSGRIRDLFFALLGGGLLYLCYRPMPLATFLERAKNVHYGWVGWVIVTHLANHVLRAYRWLLLLRSQGRDPGWWATFLAEMSGFCANAMLPRAGEWLRCERIRYLAGIPIRRSMGTVVVERGMDMVCFALLLMAVLWKGDGVIGRAASALGIWESMHILLLVCLVVVLAVGGVFVYHKCRHAARSESPLYASFSFLQDLSESAWATCRATTWWLWLITLAIWGLHFLVEYFSLFAVEGTASLGLCEAVYLFLALNVGMASPTPGGIGTYDIAMMTMLSLFGVNREVGQFYTAMMHLIQLFNAWVVGGACFLFTLALPLPNRGKYGQEKSD